MVVITFTGASLAVAAILIEKVLPEVSRGSEIALLMVFGLFTAVVLAALTSELES